jgi:protein-tyrosine phosphatase
MILTGRRFAAGPFKDLPTGAFGLCLDPGAPNRADAALVLDIEDFGLPDAAALRATLDALQAAMAAEPERLFYIGCRAGLGRTGTVLACLAVECGLVGDPVAWVRNQHDPRAVETPAQEAFARAWRRAAAEN